MFVTRWPENRSDLNDVIYDADGACMGRYGCVGMPMMGSREWVVLDLKSRAASARVTKYFATIFSITCNKYDFIHIILLITGNNPFLN